MRATQEKIIYDVMDTIDKTGKNTQIYKDLFKKLSNAEFKDFVERLRTREYLLSVVYPNGDKDVKISLSELDKAYKKYDIPLQVKAILKEDDFRYETDIEYTMLILPLRRFKQHMIKGLAVPKDNSKRDAVTGQVVGPSRTGAVSNAEIPVLAGSGLKEVLDEFISVRGGDVSATTKLTENIINNGTATLKDLAPYRTGSKSVPALKSLFKAMHIDINL